MRATKLTRVAPRDVDAELAQAGTNNLIEVTVDRWPCAAPPCVTAADAATWANTFGVTMGRANRNLHPDAAGMLIVYRIPSDWWTFAWAKEGDPLGQRATGLHGPLAKPVRRQQTNVQATAAVPYGTTPAPGDDGLSDHSAFAGRLLDILEENQESYITSKQLFDKLARAMVWAEGQTPEWAPSPTPAMKVSTRSLGRARPSTAGIPVTDIDSPPKSSSRNPSAARSSFDSNNHCLSLAERSMTSGTSRPCTLVSR